MRSIRIVCLLVTLGSATLVAQSNTAAIVNRPVSSKGSSRLSKPDAKTQGNLLESYGKLPLSFEVNQGQTDASVKFLSRGSGYTLFLTADEAIFSMRGSKADGEALPARKQLKPAVVPAANAVLGMKLVKANLSATVTGADELPGKSNYFIGNNPKKWRSGVANYAKVKYKNIYSGIDLVYYGNQRQLEYDFVVAPGADPHRIQFKVRGAKKISRDEHGELVAQIGEGEVRWHPPVVYQEKDGSRQTIAAHYDIKDKDQVGFEIAGYDLRRPLFIDPLIYSTYLGGSGDDAGISIAVDSSGNAYVTGLTGSTDFPTVNPTEQYGGGFDDAFVAKLNPTGSALIYSTYLGGNDQDAGIGIAVDRSGNALVTGYTYSTDFPTVNALQPAYGGGTSDAFVAKLNPTGSALVYSTYLGGNNQDGGNGIAMDSAGNAYVTGETLSTDFPVMNPLQPASGGNVDAFVAQINPTGSALVYSTYLGGSAQDWGLGIAVDNSGRAYISGYTNSTDFPTVNPLQPANAGGYDAFVAQINPAGSTLVYSTYLGGSSAEVGYGIAVDGSGNAYITGYTTSTDFPTMNPLQPTYGGGTSDAFVAQISPAGSALVYSTYLGGNDQDEGIGIAVDGSGNVYITGVTASTNFPIMNPLQPASGGGQDAFVAQLNPNGSALVYSTYLGGNNQDEGIGIAVDSSGNAYVTGQTFSTNFPTMNPLQRKYGGGGDVFVARIAKPSPFVRLVPPKVDFGNQTVGITSAPQKATLTNTGELTLTITSINVTGPNSGDFAQTNNCGTSVPPKGSCKITVTFTPSATGARNAAVSITDNAPNSPQSIPLSGVGVLPAATFSPSSLMFQDQVVHTMSPALPVKLKNTGLGMLLISDIRVSGPFLQTNNCPNSINPGAHCTINVKFNPKNKGLLKGTVSVTDNAPDSPQKLPLTGTGTFVQLIPTMLNFGGQPVGTRSLARKIRLTNKGDAAVNITSISITGADSNDYAETNTCGNKVASGASCFIKVTFKPLMKGKRKADVSISDDGGGSPQKAPLVGTGT